jgi:uridine phosphorylase
MFESLQKFIYNGNSVLNMEMESSALYALSHLMGHRAITVCVVLANRIKGDYSIEPGKDTINMLEKCLAILADSKH